MELAVGETGVARFEAQVSRLQEVVGVPNLHRLSPPGRKVRIHWPATARSGSDSVFRVCRRQATRVNRIVAHRIRCNASSVEAVRGTRLGEPTRPGSRQERAGASPSGDRATSATVKPYTRWMTRLGHTTENPRRQGVGSPKARGSASEFIPT